MFSREWFFYVFGRWIVISGIAGALMQVLLGDKLGIPTFPAFLLNQFCLACVFWYVDRLIFKRHLGRELSDFFRFPVINVHFSLADQLAMVRREFEDLEDAAAGCEEEPERWLNEFVDLVHSTEMLERMLRERKVPVDAEFERVREENRRRGLYAKGAVLVRKAPQRSRDFLREIAHRTLVCDGAAGTWFFWRGIEPGACVEHLCISRPDLVEECHRSYIDAGARIIETNTHGANAIQLARFGLEGEVEKVNREAVRIARKVAGRRAFVAGCVGRVEGGIVPHGKHSADVFRRAYRQQIRVLADAGCDLILIETIQGLTEAREIVAVAHEVCALPIVCQLAAPKGDPAEVRHQLEEDLARLHEAGADVVGLNCNVGPDRMARLVEGLKIGAPLSIQPNAALDVAVDSRAVTTATPAQFARYARAFVEAGAAIVGGCCGTTPDHIRAVAEEIAGLVPEIHHEKTAARG